MSQVHVNRVLITPKCFFIAAICWLIICIVLITHCDKMMPTEWLEECCGEKMVYSVKLKDSRTISGQKFNCTFKWLLDRYKLSDKYAIQKKIKVKNPGHPKFTFVTAANDHYYPSLRLLIANIKEKFGCTQQIIAYDLGNVTKNKQWLNELNTVCNLKWRMFDFSQMVDDRVRHLKSFAWKIFVIAHVLSEYDTVIWVDTSINFESNNLSKFLAPIQEGKIGSVQVPSFSSHGMNVATHPGMYKYLPLHSNFDQMSNSSRTPHYYQLTNNTDPPQFETNFVILHKTDQTRQLLKWALLCAADPDCIVPIGQAKECIYTPLPINKTCHRQDQSLIEILRQNTEYQQQMNDPSFMAQLNPAHPRNTNRPLKSPGIKGLFQVKRCQTFPHSAAEWLQQVQCCADKNERVNN